MVNPALTMSTKQHLLRNHKLQAAYNLLKQASPGEINDLISDIHVLLNGDAELCMEIKKLSVAHNIKNFIPIQLNGHQVLIILHNDLGNGRFLDPESRVLFVTIVCNVFTKTLNGKTNIVACIEAHKFSPSAFWNGIWRSEWAFLLTPPDTRVSGYITIESSYYEHGTIHLSVNQLIDETLHIEDMSEAAKEFIEIVEKADNKIQDILKEEFKGYSDNTLPLTYTVLGWNKLIESRIKESKCSSHCMQPL
ncbi:F-actin-capping protein subunit alpha-2-like [Mixophyes fleayi]|uniref:F-actin-capping protein subunit alpha-2-like n=1 Tax=Mixophyes fleayi TaxID=3061075 RepID=UPI003F4D8F04